MFLRTKWGKIWNACWALLMVLTFSGNALGHEPVFSLGPETIYKGGMGIEAEFELDDNGSDREQRLNYELIYGLTENIAFTLKVPQVIDKESAAHSSSGLGDIALRGKYQFYKKDTLGAQDKATLIYGLEFPSGDEDKSPPLGNGASAHFFGLSLGHESTTLYGFATGRYILRTDSGSLDKGDQVLFDVAFGFRPWLRPYKSWDLIVLLENSYIWTGKDKQDGTGLDNSGGQKFLIGPTFLWSIRNVMLKGGVQFPIWEDLNGNQQDTDFRSIVALEYHF